MSLDYRHTSFGATLRELGQAHEVSQHNLRAMTREFRDTKRLAKNGLDGMHMVFPLLIAMPHLNFIISTTTYA